MIQAVALAALAAQAHVEVEARLPLAILYAGAPGTTRELDWLAFLRANFDRVESVSLRDLDAHEAQDFDVVVADWSWRSSRDAAPIPMDHGEGLRGYRLDEPIRTPIVMVGGIGGELDEKTKLRGL
jgi:hypothetical protein